MKIVIVCAHIVFQFHESRKKTKHRQHGDGERDDDDNNNNNKKPITTHTISTHYAYRSMNSTN